MQFKPYAEFSPESDLSFGFSWEKDNRENENKFSYIFCILLHFFVRRVKKKTRRSKKHIILRKHHIFPEKENVFFFTSPHASMPSKI
jgi:hypothetical protein